MFLYVFAIDLYTKGRVPHTMYIGEIIETIR